MEAIAVGVIVALVLFLRARKTVTIEPVNPEAVEMTFEPEYDDRLIRTDTGMPNEPTADVITNLATTTAALRDIEAQLKAVGIADTVTSGYRNARVNAAVGGSTTSYHLYGLAVDLVVAPEMRDKAASIVTAYGRNHNFFEMIRYSAKPTLVHFALNKPGESRAFKVLTDNGDGTYSTWGG